MGVIDFTKIVKVRKAQKVIAAEARRKAGAPKGSQQGTKDVIQEGEEIILTDPYVPGGSLAPAEILDFSRVKSIKPKDPTEVPAEALKEDNLSPHTKVIDVDEAGKLTERTRAAPVEDRPKNPEGVEDIIVDEYGNVYKEDADGNLILQKPETPK